MCGRYQKLSKNRASLKHLSYYIDSDGDLMLNLRQRIRNAGILAARAQPLRDRRRGDFDGAFEAFGIRE